MSRDTALEGRGGGGGGIEDGENLNSAVQLDFQGQPWYTTSRLLRNVPTQARMIRIKKYTNIFLNLQTSFQEAS